MRKNGRFLLERESLELTDQQKSCIAKGVYPHKKAAINAAQNLANKLDKPIRYYKCPICRDFHLTSDTSPQRTGRFKEINR